MQQDRNYIGYGADNIPDANWPNKARIAVQFVLNYEEGGENCVLHGDEHSEVFLSEIAGAQAYQDRHMSIESLYEYGSRVGVWRILNEFEERNLPLTLFAVTTALQRNPPLVEAIKKSNHDVVCHGLKWIHYQDMPIEQERQQMHEAIEVMEQLLDKKISGWYTGRDSPNTRSLVVEHPGLAYDSDYYGDDLPFWVQSKTDSSNQSNQSQAHLVIPYTLDCNDMKYSSPYGFSHSDEFYQYLKDNFDCLYAEGIHKPKMMSIGLHCRITGKPARMIALKRFLDYVQQHEDVWVASRQQIADHWIERHSPKAFNRE
ncbi:allantoinase PuuE [Vibrio sp. E150_011]